MITNRAAVLALAAFASQPALAAHNHHAAGGSHRAATPLAGGAVAAPDKYGALAAKEVLAAGGVSMATP